MRVSGNRPTQGPYGAQPVRSRTASDSTSSASASRSVEDASAVLGIPEAEFTPRVRDAIMKLMGEVDGLRRELAHARQRLEEMESVADQDVMLPVLNRRAFVREMSRVVSFVERYSLPASVIYLDLDNFKEINDTHGHAAGDVALHHVCEVLRKNVRESDLIGRLGGDEFGVILAKADQAQANAKAESLSRILQAKPCMHEGKTLTLSCSFGAYMFQRGENAADAIAKADRAMYERKRGRKAAAR